MIEGAPMKRILAVSAALLCLASMSIPASAFCGTGDTGQGCGRPFANSNSSSQSDDTSTQQGFDAQTGTQWSTTNHKVGDFNFYTGMSSGNGWGSHDPFARNGFNTPNFNSQGQSNSLHCAYYGTC
jgi:hypothetical protein